MKVFVCEYITGGGLYPGDLPASLAGEGGLMRDALLQDLAQLRDISTFCTHDPRLPAPVLAHRSIKATGEGIWTLWEECIAAADAVLPIAPETGNILLRLTRMIESQGKVLLGCSAEGVRLASSKLETSRILRSAGIDAVPTYEIADFPLHDFHKCVIKPDDGVGCESATVFSRIRDFEAWRITADTRGFVVQPYMDGIPASFSMLCNQGQAWLLSCNRQKIALHENRFVYEGSILNATATYWGAFAELASRISQAMPSLSGYIGVDAIIHNSSISILEVNPRITTSYAGLHRSLGHNPAGLLIDLLYNCRFSSEQFRMPAHLQRNEVEVSLHG